MTNEREALTAATEAALLRDPPNHIVDDPFGATGEAESDPYGYGEDARRNFVAGALFEYKRTHGAVTALEEMGALAEGEPPWRKPWREFQDAFLGDVEPIPSRFDFFLAGFNAGAAGYRREPEPREVTTVEELDALPVGSVILSASGRISARFDSAIGVVFGNERAYQWANLALPARILFTPSGDAAS